MLTAAHCDVRNYFIIISVIILQIMLKGSIAKIFLRTTFLIYTQIVKLERHNNRKEVHQWIYFMGSE